jgi:hypothetical protein
VNKELVVMAASQSPQLDAPRAGPQESEKEVRKQVRNLLSNILYASGTSSERRRQIRYPFPQPVYLTLLGENGLVAEGEAIVAAGKDISETGLAFFHATPLPAQQMIVSLEVSHGKWLAFVIQLTRSHAIRHGWYESGGRFVRPVAPPPLDAT